MSCGVFDLKLMCWYVDVVMIVGHDAVLDIPGDVHNLASVEEAGREEV